MRHFNGTFTSIVDLKVKLMEEFESLVPSNTHFSVGYFEGRHSAKKWLMSRDDLIAMYSHLNLSGKTSMCLWCDGCSRESDGNSRKRKRDSSPAPPSKRAVKEKEVDDVAAELKELHCDSHNYSDPQYRLWARMFVNGLHSSKETPPQVPMITGITPTRSTRKSLEDTVASTVSAVVKAIASPNSCTSIESQSGVGKLSPSKAVDIRGKCFAQLASLKQLFEESVITEDELQEQKSSILKTLRKLS